MLVTIVIKQVTIVNCYIYFMYFRAGTALFSGDLAGAGGSGLGGAGKDAGRIITPSEHRPQAAIAKIARDQGPVPGSIFVGQRGLLKYDCRAFTRSIHMAKTSGTTNKRPVEQYEHKGKQRANNPPVGLVDAKTDVVEGKKTYAYDPHLDPALQWAGKAERTSFEIPTVSLHVHERIDPRAIIEAVRKKNGSDYAQLSLFGSRTENPPLREAIEFYKHAHNWSNRFVAGDSLLVTTGTSSVLPSSLAAEK